MNTITQLRVTFAASFISIICMDTLIPITVWMIRIFLTVKKMFIPNLIGLLAVSRVEFDFVINHTIIVSWTDNHVLPLLVSYLDYSTSLETRHYFSI